MRKPKPRTILAIVVVLFFGATIYHFACELKVLKNQNARLEEDIRKLKVTRAQSPVIEKSDENDMPTSKVYSDNGLKELDQMRMELADAVDGRKQAEAKLAEILRSTEEDILSSTLKTRVTRDEVLVTGGYRTDDGNYQFSMVSPTSEELPDGRDAIVLRPRHFAISTDAMQMLGLDSLSTNAGNVLQHGEIWSLEGFQQFLKTAKEIEGVEMLVSPKVTLLSGMEAEISVGEFHMKTTPTLVDDGKGFDIELRIEQPRESQSKDL